MGFHLPFKGGSALRQLSVIQFFTVFWFAVLCASKIAMKLAVSFTIPNNAFFAVFCNVLNSGNTVDKNTLLADQLSYSYVPFHVRQYH